MRRWKYLKPLGVAAVLFLLLQCFVWLNLKPNQVHFVYELFDVNFFSGEIILIKRRNLFFPLCNNGIKNKLLPEKRVTDSPSYLVENKMWLFLFQIYLGYDHLALRARVAQ